MVSGTSDVDSIVNSGGNYVTVNAGAGNDTIQSVWGTNITLRGGEGNDLIKLDKNSNRNVIHYVEGDGSDTVIGFNPTDLVKLTGEVTGSILSGNDLTLNVGSGSITFRGIENYLPIQIQNADGSMSVLNYSYSYDSGVALSGTSAADSIFNGGNYATVDGNAGNDLIASLESGALTIKDVGAQTVNINGGSLNIVGTAVSNESDSVLDRDDTLRVTSGSIASYENVGADVIVTLKKGSTKGTITLQGAGNHVLKQDGSDLIVDDIRAAITS